MRTCLTDRVKWRARTAAARNEGRDVMEERKRGTAGRIGCKSEEESDLPEIRFSSDRL